MTPAANERVSRKLAKIGYRFAGLQRDTANGRTIVAAAATPDNGADVPPVSAAAFTEKNAVKALLAAAAALAA